MEVKILNERQQFVLSLLQEKRLKEALEEIERLFWDKPSAELNTIKTTYDYMLKYMLDGVQDPQRYNLHEKLIRETLELSDAWFLAEFDKVSNKFFHQRRRSDLPQLQNINYGSLLNILEGFQDELAVSKLVGNTENINLILARHEKALADLFSKAWLSNSWSTAEKEEADRFIQSSQLSENDFSLLISAVTLGLLSFFDAKKMAWLIDAYKKNLVFASPRALVGLVMVINQQKNRLAYYPDLSAQISFLFEDKKTTDLVNEIYLQFLQGQETEKIDRKMREEIIPEMMKNASNMQDLKLGFEENQDEDGHNPDWQEALEKSGMGDKIREINELQMQGADVYMSSFSTLKGYPFFYSIQNWFYPFDIRHSTVYHEFGALDEKGSVVDLILNSGLFCNSDKYSLCFTFQHIPKSQRDTMLNQLTEQQMGGLEEEQKIAKLQELTEKPSVITNQYIHDLYRFFKLFRFKNDFIDIFNTHINFHEIELLGFLKKDTGYLSSLAKFFLKNEHYARAIEIYQLLERMDSVSFELFQKLGYCYQMTNQYGLAVEAYIKADTLKPDNVWTNRHLAYSYRAMGEHQKALYYYLAVEKAQPENLSILFYIGMCYTALDQYDDALQYFFKMDFLKQNSKRAWRAIGWCSFISDKLEQSKNYYAKVLANKPSAIDFLNAGHVEWSLGDLKEAVKYYNTALGLYKDKDTFLELLKKDEPYLIKKGISKKDIPLLIDLLGPQA